jgi:hypothetical protein
VSERTGTCPCGQLSATCTGDPVRISVCHCLNCKRRSGSAFAAQARWPDDRVRLTGEHKQWQQAGDSGGVATHSFCPACGVTVAYVLDSMPGLTAVPVGIFADPAFPPPVYSVYEERKHAWVEITGDLEHFD